MSNITDLNEVRAKLVGAWNLVSMEEVASDGSIDNLLRDGAVGKIIYTPEGYVSAHVVRRKIERFKDDDWHIATDEDAADAWRNYSGFFGTYEIDIEQKRIVHHIEGAWFPNFIGAYSIRHFGFEDSKLILEAIVETGRTRIVWTKAEN
jgi:hypothetical protein